ncbi:hypothetical protein Syun_018873 [Stephania yunnanensis]|uniref:Uncharacterized protein n=1 Tax=Stephania yunnanensis TaxID=152371 RepID=A0AAP0NYU4_9MAGN
MGPGLSPSETRSWGWFGPSRPLRVDPALDQGSKGSVNYSLTEPVACMALSLGTMGKQTPGVVSIREGRTLSLAISGERSIAGRHYGSAATIGGDNGGEAASIK